MKYCWTLLIAFIFSANIFANDLELSFLDTKTIGALEFIKNNPSADGRGVLLYILDSGVDPSVRGLLVTSEVKTKVIEMQDFTGQVEIEMNEAKLENDFLIYEKIKLEGFSKLDLKSKDGKYLIGIIDEAKFYKNSEVKDINNNGRKDDKISVLVFKISDVSRLKDAKGHVKADESKDIWVYYVDEDLNGKIDDEKARFDYKYNMDYFDFTKYESGKKSSMAMSANFCTKRNVLIINTNDNAHGTHCAGIATGYQINGQAGYNGIAPGAFVGSLKIGNDVLSGGATTTESMKKAYEYGVKFMKEAGFKYAVFSMSYGIGSETPGKSDMEIFLEDFARKHPEIIIVKSMGNSGPGINTVGNPSTVNSTLAIGAMIAPSTLQDLYGSQRKENWITAFSSRGGCVSQPDVVAPGAAASTVPEYTKGDAFWGTSMSTPEVAGACALLFSAALKNNITVDGFMIRKAIKYSASKMNGYTSVDYGNGLVDVNKAWEYLKILSKREEYKKLINYEITTTNTFFEDNKGGSAYWNVGGYFPSTNDKQSVSIKAVFPKDITDKEKSEFYRILSMKSDADWLKIDKSKIYLKSDVGAGFNISYDKSKMTLEGMYSARVFGFTENEENGGFADFDFQVTVIIPHKASINQDSKITIKDKKLNIGDIHRYFIEIPMNASAMNVSLEPIGSQTYDMALNAFDPSANRPFFGGRSNKSINYKVAGDDLDKGIWELIPYSFYQSSVQSNYNLNVKFYNVLTEPKAINSIDYSVGEQPELNFRLFSAENNSLKLNLTGAIQGYSKKNSITQSGKVSYKKKIKIADDIKSIVFEVEMPNSEFNKMTDIAVNVYDANGKSLMSDGMSRKKDKLTFTPPSAGEYEFEIYPGFISKEVMDKDWTFDITEKYYYKQSIAINNKSLEIFPQKWYDINLQLNSAFPIVPNDYETFGEVHFNQENGDMVGKMQIKL